MTESVAGCYTNYPHAEAPNDCKKCDIELKKQCQLIAENKPKRERKRD